MSIQLNANTHKFLLDKFEGKADQSLSEYIDSVLGSVGIFETNSHVRLKEFFNLVDFGEIFVDVLNSILIEKWAQTNETWRIWVNNYSLNDFRPELPASVGLVDEPQKLVERREYKHSSITMESSAARAQLADYGRLIQLTTQDVMNDNVSALKSFISSIVNAYDKLIGDHVYGTLFNNVVLDDGKELFHQDRNNTFAAGGVKANLVGAIEAMTTHKWKFGDATTTDLPIAPKYVIASPEMVFTLADEVERFNKVLPEMQKLQIVMERRLIGKNSWYLVCDNPYSSISLFTLRGQSRPEIITKNLFSTNGISIKHRMAFDVKTMDPRGLVRIGE